MWYFKNLVQAFTEMIFPINLMRMLMSSGIIWYGAVFMAYLASIWMFFAALFGQDNYGRSKKYQDIGRYEAFDLTKIRKDKDL